MLLPIGYVKMSRYETLAWCANKAEMAYNAVKLDPNAASDDARTREFISTIERQLREQFGTKIIDVSAASLFYLPGWLAMCVWDIMSANGRVFTETGDITAVKRRYTPLPTTEDIRHILAEKLVPVTPLPKDAILTPRQLAQDIVDLLRQVRYAAAAVEFEFAGLARAVRHIAWKAREGAFDLGAGGDQFEKSLLLHVMSGRFADNPSLQAQIVNEPVRDEQALAALSRVRERVIVAPAESFISFYGMGSIDGTIAIAVPYANSLTAAQGRFEEMVPNAIRDGHLVRLSLKEIPDSTIKWDLTKHLKQAMTLMGGQLAYSLGQPELQAEGIDQARVPARLIPSAGLLDSAIIMDAPDVGIVNRSGNYSFKFKSAFRSRTVFSVSDNEYLLDIMMSPSRRQAVRPITVENMTLARFSNVIFTQSDALDYFSPAFQSFPVSYMVSTGLGGFRMDTRNIDMRTVLTEAACLNRPALAPNVLIDRDALMTPHAREDTIFGQLGLDDLSRDASVLPVRVSLNAAFIAMTLGQTPDTEFWLRHYRDGRNAPLGRQQAPR